MEFQYQLSYPQLERVKKFGEITGKSQTRFVQASLLLTITNFSFNNKTHPQPWANGLIEEIFTVKIPKKYESLYETYYEYYDFDDSDLVNGTIEMVLEYFEGNWNGELIEDDVVVDVSNMSDKEKFQLLKETNKGENFNVFF